jgi:ADP-ribose pyrophosphatase
MRTTWQRISREIIISNSWLTIEKNDYKIGNKMVNDFFIIRRSPFVLVIAETISGVVLVRQYRPATERHYWALPAGFIDGNEGIINAASRELTEETGLVGQDFCHVGTLDPLPGYVSSAAHIVRCVVPNIGVCQPIDDEIDHTDVRPWPEIIEMIREGHINEMQAVSALLLVKVANDENNPPKANSANAKIRATD